MCILSTTHATNDVDIDELDIEQSYVAKLPDTAKAPLLSPAAHFPPDHCGQYEHPIATLLPDACAMEFCILPPNAESLAKLLSALIKKNNIQTAKATGRRSVDMFTLKDAPSLDLQTFIEEYIKEGLVDQPTLVFISALLLRLISGTAHTPAVVDVSIYNAHRLFAAVAVVAAKFINDRVYPMSFYAWCLRLEFKDLCQLESAILGLLNYDLVVHIDEFNATSRLLMQQM